MLQPKKQQQKLQLKINPGSRVFGYIRVSTYYQKEYGASLEAQKDRILKHCKENNLSLPYLYEDAAQSGKNIHDRPSMKALLADIRTGDIYIFTSISRLGRKTLDNIYIFELFNQNNCKIIILDSNIDITSEAGKIIYQMFSVVSEAERDLISRRTKEVMQHMKQKRTLRTKPPFGYQVIKKDDKKFTIDNLEEQEVIKYIKQLIKSNPNITITAIMQALLDSNMSFRKGKMYHERIRSILNRENIRGFTQRKKDT